MTACEWETRWNPEGVFGKHAFLLRETRVKAGRVERTITFQWCCCGAVQHIPLASFFTNTEKNIFVYIIRLSHPI